MVAGFPFESFFGNAEGIDRRRHTTVKHHLRNDLGDLLPSHTDVEGCQDVPPQQLRAVAQHGQRGDGTKAAGLQVDRRPIVNLPIDHLVDQLHNVRGKLRHRRWLARVSVPAIIPKPEVNSCFAQVFGATFKRQGFFSHRPRI